MSFGDDTLHPDTIRDIKIRELLKNILEKAIPQYRFAHPSKRKRTGYWIVNLKDENIEFIKEVLNENSR